MKDCDHDALSSIIDAFTFKTTKARKRKKTNVIPFKRSRSSAAKMRARLRSMHGQKIVTAQLFTFPFSGSDYVIPVIRGDTPALPPLADFPMTDSKLGREVGMGGPKAEQFFKGHSELIARDELSLQVGNTLPATGAIPNRTICPMGRGRTPVKFNRELAQRTKSGRVAAGYGNLRAFAQLMGVEWERWKKYESGRTPIAHELVPRYCELTGKDANYLFATAQEKQLPKAG